VQSNLLDFSQWIQEGVDNSFDIGDGTPVPGWIAPTHEQLADLFWFKALRRVLETVGGSSSWITGDRAYANGTRIMSCRIDDTYSYHDERFAFYPKNGTIVNPDGGRSVKSGLPFATLEDWNLALAWIYFKTLARFIMTAKPKEISKLVLAKDSDALEQMFSDANQFRERNHIALLPDGFLFAILTQSPEEVEVMQDLRRLGLL